MLAPEDGIDLLIEQFRTLSRRDRQAVMARLSFEERVRLEARMRGGAAPARPAPYSPDIMARIADAKVPDGTGIAPSAREALRRAVAGEIADAPSTSPVERSASLMDAIGTWFGRFGR